MICYNKVNGTDTLCKKLNHLNLIAMLRSHYSNLYTIVKLASA